MSLYENVYIVFTEKKHKKKFDCHCSELKYPYQM